MGALLIQKNDDGSVLMAVVPDMAPEQMQGAQTVPDLAAASKAVMDVLGDEGAGDQPGGAGEEGGELGGAGGNDYAGNEEQHPGNQEQPPDQLDPATAGDNIPAAGGAKRPPPAAATTANAMESGYQSVKGGQPRRR